MREGIGDMRQKKEDEAAAPGWSQAQPENASNGRQLNPTAAEGVAPGLAQHGDPAADAKQSCPNVAWLELLEMCFFYFCAFISFMSLHLHDLSESTSRFAVGI